MKRAPVSRLMNWSLICRSLGITEEHERAFVRDLALSRSDATYYSDTYEAKRIRTVQLYETKHALEKELAMFDAALPARLADCAASDLDVAGAARWLARYRLVMADRVAARTHEFQDMASTGACDLQLLRRAEKARDEMTAYYTQARCVYWANRKGAASRAEDSEGPDIVGLSPEHCRLHRSGDTLSQYTGLSPENCRPHPAARRKCVAFSVESAGDTEAPQSLPHYIGQSPEHRREHRAHHRAGV